MYFDQCHFIVYRKYLAHTWFCVNDRKWRAQCQHHILNLLQKNFLLHFMPVASKDSGNSLFNYVTTHLSDDTRKHTLKRS